MLDINNRLNVHTIYQGEKSMPNEVYIGDYFLEEPQYPRVEENDMEDTI
jgi:hypothetical protein